KSLSSCLESTRSANIILGYRASWRAVGNLSPDMVRATKSSDANASWLAEDQPSMQLGKLRLYFETSPAMRLLRSQNAPYVVDFLYQQFKRSGKIAVASSDLLAALNAYQEAIQEFDPDVLRDKAETYLSTWCANETRWLHRFIDA